MRGKKADNEFVSNFIKECVVIGHDTTQAIVNIAKSNIKEIDDEILALEKKKIIRSKLLDVIDIFEKPYKNKSQEIQLLAFFKLKNPKVCKTICDLVSENPIDINNINSSPETIFSIKQLLEYKILDRVGNHILRGIRYK